MSIESVNCALEIKGDVADDGTFKGYGSVFGNVDLGGDIVAEGAFKRSLASGRRVKMLWQHNQRQPIGVYPVIEEDTKGLYLEGKYVLEVQAAREAHALMKAKALDGLSIGFRAVKWEIDSKSGVRTLLDVDLYEVSPVTFAMNPKAKVISVKSVREFEELLREAGFSRKQVAVIVNEGYKRLDVARDADDEEQIVTALRKNINILSGAKQ